MVSAQPLTPTEFDFLWEAHSDGEVPYPLEVRSHGATMDERAALRRKTLHDLSARGLVDEFGTLREALARRFDRLAGAELSVDSVHINEPESAAVLGLAGAMDGKAVLAVQEAHGVTLDDIDAQGLADAVVGLLPHAQRGKERSITMPIEQLMAQPGADFLQRRPAEEFPGGARRWERSGRGDADDERKALARLHAQPRLRGGQIGANGRASLGGSSRSPVLSWFDTETGRYLTQASRGADGREWITIAPADTRTMRQRVAEMVTGVRRVVAAR